MVNTQIAIRPARQSDHSQIANLMYFEPHVHRHLDWRGPLDWLGAPEYWVLEQFGAVSAALACPPDPEGVAWLRLFAHSSSLPLAEAWNLLWENVKITLRGRDLTVSAITVTDWLATLLSDSGFDSKQQIVVLEYSSSRFEQRPIPAGVTFRRMIESDLPAVAVVDAAGFAPLWRNSLPALRSGFAQAGFATVAEIDGELVGYQISTRNSFGAHLARLAVSPQAQGHGIGYLLVQDLLNQARYAGLYRLTVNTQNDNATSLALYQKIGFHLTGERYTVFTYPL
jgi:ribosomal protein S18 acetylase RimI-like enzyme